MNIIKCHILGIYLSYSCPIALPPGAPPQVIPQCVGGTSDHVPQTCSHWHIEHVYIHILVAVAAQCALMITADMCQASYPYPMVQKICTCS